MNRNIHRPLHLYLDDNYYFISARTIKSKRFFYGGRKNILLQILKSSLDKYYYTCYAWGILDNHYHILIKIKEGAEKLKFFIKELHSQSSKTINKLDNSKGRQVWYQYWDRCIRDKEDFWYRFNYIHHNPVKHEYVINQKGVLNYRYCSYRLWMEKKGQKWLDECFDYYPSYFYAVEGID